MHRKTCTDLLQFTENSEGDGHHHRGGGRVRDPHGDEGGDDAEAAEQLRVAAAERVHHDQGDSQVQIAVLGGDGEDEAADEDHDGVVHVADARLLAAEDAEQREQHHRYQRRDGDRQTLRHPVAAH